jgi:ATP-dependent Lhr-like helicase
MFGASLKPGDTFRFAGLDLEVEAMRDLELVVRAAKQGRRRSPATWARACR